MPHPSTCKWINRRRITKVNFKHGRAVATVNVGYASFEGFTAVKIQVVVFRVVTLCSDAIWYRRFGGPCCLHLQAEHLELYVPRVYFHSALSGRAQVWIRDLSDFHASGRHIWRHYDWTICPTLPVSKSVYLRIDVVVARRLLISAEPRTFANRIEGRSFLHSVAITVPWQ